MSTIQLHKPTPREEVVEALRAALVLAEAGELTSIVLAGERIGNAVYTHWTFLQDGPGMIGILECIKTDLIRTWLDSK